ncbi:hypothetical protein [Streptomyces sp. NBC_01500]|uniref:hypothetical protein n=1 Tax=Streptomyces sp. NBC_01500 TaxID=2903886 RepID=UPI00224FD070|nr:hypothetical protein [Streptomyces sp. NBC_01500]MCX4554136.1 hypothetical protein [Streptomyces sp. NBC_01500]
MTTAPRKTAASKSNAAKALEAAPEVAEDKTNEFEFKGKTYSTPGDPLALDYFALQDVESEADIIEILVGEKGWAQFRATRPTVGEFQEFSELANKSIGWGEEGN